MARRHPLALLALVALSRSRRLSRDKLIGYLWPDRSSGRARNRLNQSVHVLRQALGEEGIVSEGDELVLNPNVVKCDVWSFEEALDAGDAERSVDLYVGPFLDGFFLGNSLEFERWADAERERLHRAYLKALEGRAESAAACGDREGAVEWWRRLAAEEPQNSEVVIRFMQALEAAGDRASAIREAEAHAKLLREEFGAEPSPGVLDLAERIRTRPEGTGGVTVVEQPIREPGTRLEATGNERRFSEGDVLANPTSNPRRRLSLRSPVLLFIVVLAVLGAVSIRHVLLDNPVIGSGLERKSIAVLPFANLSPSPDDAYLADGIHQEIIGQLSRIASLKVTSRTSVMEYGDRTGNVRAIARELGVANVLEGTVRYADGRLRVSVQLIDAENDEHLWAATYERHLRDVFAIQTGVARKVSAALQATLTPEEAERIGANPTDDPEAYEYYLRARTIRIDSEGEWRRMVADLDTALSLDSTFAQAWAHRGLQRVRHIAGHGQSSDTLSAAKKDIDRAVALNSNLPDTELALGFYYLDGHRDYENALLHFRRAQRLQPSNDHAIRAIGRVLSMQGRWNEAVEQFSRAIALDPRSVRAQGHLGLVHLLMRQYEEAERYLNRALILDSAAAEINVLKVQLELKRDGDVDGARAALERAVARAGRSRILYGFHHVGARKPYVRILFSDFDALMRDSLAAEKLRDWCISCVHWHEAEVALAEGRPEVARAMFDSLLTKFDTLRAYVEERPGYERNVWRFLGLYSARLGDHERAIEAAEKAVRLLPVSKDAYYGPDVLQTLAEVYLLTGQHEKAIQQLDTLLSIPSELSVPVLRLDPFWDPIRDHPGFQAMLRRHE